MDGRTAGVAAKAAAVLRPEQGKYKPSRSLREVLLVALGCDLRAGPLAYWEWESLYASLEAVREALARHVDLSRNTDVEQWANERARSPELVLQVLDAVPEAEDVPVPALPNLRPWCNPKAIAECRIPFVPLAAITHAWRDPDRSWSDVVEELDLAASLTSWDLLRRVDPVIRNVEPHGPVAAMARQLRQWMGLGDTSDFASPVRWLFSVTAECPSVSLDTLLRRAAEEREAKSART